MKEFQKTKELNNTLMKAIGEMKKEIDETKRNYSARSTKYQEPLDASASSKEYEGKISELKKNYSAWSIKNLKILLRMKGRESTIN